MTRQMKHAPMLSLILMLSVWVDPGWSQKAEVPKKTVAVMAFENTMKKPDYDWIGLGFAETVTTKLAHVHGLIVVERRQIEKAFQELQLSASGMVDPQTAQHAGKMVGAEYMLIGSFQKFDASSGALLMVNSRMMKVETTQIFETFMIRGGYDEMFDLQEQLALKVSAMLEVPLSEKEQQNLAKSETTSLLAYEYFYRGKHTTDLDEKIVLYSKALEIDPNYVFALTNLGSIYYVKSLDGNREMLERAEALCARAADIDPLHADAHYVLGSVYGKLDKKDQAISHWKAFLELRPTDDRVARVKRRLKKLEGK